MQNDERVAFFLHDTFIPQVQILETFKSRSHLDLHGVIEAFTVGAYTESGVMLELDLDETPGFPDGFYSFEPPEEFKAKAYSLNDRESAYESDPQLGRWGGKSEANKKKLELRSISQKQKKVKSFDLTLVVHSTTRKKLTGYVGFFVGRDADDIIFKKAIDGEAIFKITMKQAITVGVYTEDGTMLELNLNTLGKLPSNFYTKEPAQPRSSPKEVKSPRTRPTLKRKAAKKKK
ncbi:MAG: hypothetical protein WDO15_06195 [Bacteroidota bacterium]